MKNAIIIKNLSKNYKFYNRPQDRLKESLSLTKKSYHKVFKANDGISFSIKKGEVVGIIGKNGCGKSTLLKMITGVLNPSSGSIRVSGKITALLELGAGFNPEMTGLENLYLSGSISGYSQKEIKEKIDQIIDFAEIGEFIHQPLKTYSSGMQARLGFAFAINTEPEVLIIDEALSVGDAAFQRKCYARIEYMCKSDSVTVLFVSHSGGVIKQLCNRAILLHDGKLVIDGEPKKVVNLYEKFSDSKEIDIPKLKKEYEKMLIDEKMPKKIIESTSYYNPNLKSKSTVIYKENGAKISNLRLLDESNNKVNTIQKQDICTYSYDIEFKDNYDQVKVAMRIKDIKGIEITGHAHTIKNIEKNKKYQIKFTFKNMLNSGEYLFNCGSLTSSYGDFIALHRIIDGYMIRVTNDNKDEPSKGFVDFSFDANEHKL